MRKTTIISLHKECGAGGRRSLLLLAVAFLVAACVYDYAPSVQDGRETIVINGDILVGQETKVSISRSTIVGGERSGNLIADAVYVEGSNGSVYAGAAQSDNVYVIDLSQASPDCEYRLVIEIDHSMYESEWSPVLRASPIDTISYFIKDDAMYIQVSTHSDDNNRYYRWSVNQVWEYHAQDYAQAYYDPASDTIRFYDYGGNDYFCWNSGPVNDLMIASTEQLSENRLVCHSLFTMNNTEQRASYLYSVEIMQEAISERAYRYFHSVRQNSMDVGGLFSPQPENVRGNIVNRNDASEQVLGFVSVSLPTRKRIFIDCASLGFPVYQSADPYNEGRPVRLPLGSDWNYYYKRGYQVLEPIFDDNIDRIVGWEWIRSSCIRCQSQGGNKNKPDWWPNDHR